MIGIIVAILLYFICDAIETHLKKKREDEEYAINLCKEGLRDMGIDLDEDERKSKRRRKSDRRIDKETEEYIMFDDVRRSGKR